MKSRFDVPVQKLREGFLNNENWATGLIIDYISAVIHYRLYSEYYFEETRQSVLLKITRSFRSDEKISHAWGLIKKITIYTTIDFNRKTDEWRDRFSSDSPDEDGSRAGNEVEGLPGGIPDPETEYEAKEGFMYVFQQLEQRCQWLIEHRMHRGMEYGDIAAKLDISEGNARVALSRCLSRFRALYREAVKI